MSTWSLSTDAFSSATESSPISMSESHSPRRRQRSERSANERTGSSDARRPAGVLGPQPVATRYRVDRALAGPRVPRAWLVEVTRRDQLTTCLSALAAGLSASAPTRAVDRNPPGDPVTSIDGGTIY